MSASSDGNHKLKSCEFAVFPLPNVVAFPEQKISLHIFEPRYRKMIHDCVHSRRLLGIALPKRILAPKRVKAYSPYEVLARNQATLDPASIMGLGTVRLNETSPDGRLYIQVDIQHVGKIGKIIQDIPYFLAEGEILEEASVDHNLSKMWIDKLQAAYTEVLQDEPKFSSLLAEAIKNEDLSLATWTYLIFQWCNMDPGFMQMVLEVRDPVLRAQILTEVLSAAPGQDPDDEVQKKGPKGTVLPFPEP